MANKFTRYLQDVALSSFGGVKGNLADFQHAARLYVDDVFRLAPKTKFLYYVVFNLNPDAISGTGFQEQNRSEINYLVKKADLPKYILNNEELNQYNRKTRSYTKITYEPVNLTFHDDNAGITNSLWALYYGYYFRDRLNSADPYTDVNPAAYQNTAVLSKESQPYRYGLDNNVGEPFFRSIQLVTMSRQRFYSYLLCNPKILSWAHDNVDQSEGNGVLQNEMTIGYDAVIYNAGTVEVGNPSGFAQLHYDPIPSPLGEVGSIDVFGDVFTDNGFRGLSYLEKTRDSNLFYNNVGNRSPFGYETPSFINVSQDYYYTKNSVSGLQNYNFGAVNSISNSFKRNSEKSIAGKFKGFDQAADSPDSIIDKEYNTNVTARISAKRNEFIGVTGNQALDAYQPISSTTNDSTLNSFSTESIRLNSGDVANPVFGTSTDSYNFSNFTSSDRRISNITKELITNNPKDVDIPNSPFG